MDNYVVASPIQMPQITRRPPARRLPLARASDSSSASSLCSESTDSAASYIQSDRRTLLRPAYQQSHHLENLQLRRNANCELTLSKTLLEFIPRSERGSLSSGSTPSSLSGSPPLSPISLDSGIPSDGYSSVVGVQNLQLKKKNNVPDYKQLLEHSSTRRGCYNRCCTVEAALKNPPSQYYPSGNSYRSGATNPPAACRRLVFPGGDPCTGKENLQLRPSAKSAVGPSDFCSFCYNMEVHAAMNKSLPMPKVADRGPWRGHYTRQDGRIVCTRLLRRVCSICGATGQNAHETPRCTNSGRKFRFF